MCSNAIQSPVQRDDRVPALGHCWGHHARSLLAVGAVLLSMSGCALLNQLAAGLENYRPRVSVADVNLKGINWDTVDLNFVLAIENPNPLNVKMAGFTYALTIDGKRSLAGDQTTGVALKAHGSTRADLPLRLSWKQLISLGTKLSGRRSLPYNLAGTMGFNTPMGQVNVPYKKAGQLPTLTKPDIRPVDLRLGKVNLLAGQVQVLVDLEISNKQGGNPLDLSAMKFNVAFGGRNVLNSVLPKLPTLPQGQTRKTLIPVNVGVVQLGATLVKALTGHGVVDVRLSGQANVNTVLGVLPLKFDQVRQLKVH